MTPLRRHIHVNPEAEHFRTPPLDKTRIQRFHQKFPRYEPTRLISLDGLARECNVKKIYLKDESSRFGLPAFKVLGASWGTFHAVAARVGLQPDDAIEEIATAAQRAGIKLFAATDGNHGRAVSYVARLLSISAFIYVPSTLEGHIKDLIREEGGTVIVSSDYDGAVKEAAAAAAAAEDDAAGILVQDTAYPGYEEIPARIVEGYSTMLSELDDQLLELGSRCDVAISPVGVGSLAEAVTRHFKSKEHAARMVTVEPDTAACLWTSLEAGQLKTVRTCGTIMTGMECGTVSLSAWPMLSQGADYSLTLSDFESHEAVQYLDRIGISSGPCGAAGVAAIRRLAREESRSALPKGADTVVVLINTEGRREYTAPHDVSSDDPVELTQTLTQIESTNPSLSASRGSGETQVVNYIEAWLQHRNIESHRIESVSGRPSVIGVVNRSKTHHTGKSLMINGHVDTVSIATYKSDPLSGKVDVRNGNEVVLGRGSLDMKAGVAAGMNALAACVRDLQHNGRVILAAVSDEEDASQGTQDIIAAGWRADGAVIPEPTKTSLGNAHKGFAWVEVNVVGEAAHGSEPTLGVDAIMKAGKFLTALERYADALPVDRDLGQATLHCGLIHGGEEPASYPESCKITIEFRTVPAQTSESILKDVEKLLRDISDRDPQFRYVQPKVIFHQSPYKLPATHPFLEAAVRAAEGATGKNVSVESMKFWCDAALLGEAGIPTVIFGPNGEGLHANEEWVEIESVRQTTHMLKSLIEDWCA